MSGTMDTPKKLELEDWLDDLCVRFIINLSREDLQSIARICFQVEEAQWFYEDFIRPLDPTLPSMSLRNFCLRIFQHCPIMHGFTPENHLQAFDEFMQYKSRVPVRGAIMLNDTMDSAVLVKGWKAGANWSFPRGKINKDEDDLECAIREVDEETGFDLRKAGLVPADNKAKYIEVTMRQQQVRLYVFCGVPMSTPFAPRTRKEISKIAWYKLSELPAFRKKGINGQHDTTPSATAANKFYMVAPFLVPLRKWIGENKMNTAAPRSFTAAPAQATQEPLPIDPPIEPLELAAEADGVWTQTVQATIQVLQHSQASLSILEDNTRELQRLLNIQPPVSGIQHPSSEAVTRRDKGDELLAFLQTRPQASNDEPPHIPPKIPLDHVIAFPTVPPSPQRHHQKTQHHLPTSAYSQPPPSFPMPPSTGLAPPGVGRPSASATATSASQAMAPGSRVIPNGSQHLDANRNTSSTTAPGSTDRPARRQILTASTSNAADRRPSLFVDGTTADPAQRPDNIRNDPRFIQAVSVQSDVPNQDTSPRPWPVAPANGQHASSYGLDLPPVPSANEHRSALLDLFRRPSSSPIAPTPVSADQIPLRSAHGLPARLVADPAPPASLRRLPSPSISYALPSPLSATMIPPAAVPASAHLAPHLTQQQRLNLIYGGAADAGPAWLMPPATSAFATPNMLHRRPAASTEQKQKLLSLFGQPQSPPPAAAAPTLVAVPPLSQPQPQYRSSRSSTRSGAAAPISPADRTFLLGYLQSMTK